MSTIAMVIARGGSTRLPRKNVKSFCGIPLVAWAIIQAKSSILIDEVWLSTDDSEIESIGLEYGAKVLRRPDWPNPNEIAGNGVYLHFIEEMQKIYGNDFDLMVSMLPTTPLNKPEDLDNGIREYHRQGCDRILPLIPKREMVAVKKIHPFRGRYILFEKGYSFLGEGTSWSINHPNWYLNLYKECSILDSVLNHIENWPLTEINFMPIEYWQYADVDTLEEFEFAEILMEHYVLKGQGRKVYDDYYKKCLYEKELQINIGKYVGNIKQLGERK